MSEPLVDEAAFRRAMGRFPTGVSVLTTGWAGQDHAMTVNTLTSISLHPPLVLVCIEQEARFHDAVVEAGVFGASILDAEQRWVSEWFATRGRPLHGQLDRVPHRRGEVTGVALVEGALAGIECRVRDVHEAGDHSILVADVVGLDLPDTVGSALIWYRARYGALA